MLASTLSGEPGTLQRFAETAVGGTQLDITELRHRCLPQGPARLHHDYTSASARLLAYKESVGCRRSVSLGLGVLGVWQACAHALDEAGAAARAGTLRAAPATCCGAWACGRARSCRRCCRACRPPASQRATSPPSRPSRHAPRPSGQAAHAWSAHVSQHGPRLCDYNSSAAHHRAHAVDNVASLRLYASGVCLSVLVPRAAGARTREARALPTGCYC